MLTSESILFVSIPLMWFEVGSMSQWPRILETSSVQKGVFIIAPGQDLWVESAVLGLVGVVTDLYAFKLWKVKRREVFKTSFNMLKKTYRILEAWLLLS